MTLVVGKGRTLQAFGANDFGIVPQRVLSFHRKAVETAAERPQISRWIFGAPLFGAVIRLYTLSFSEFRSLREIMAFLT